MHKVWCSALDKPIVKESKMHVGMIPIPERCPWFYVDKELSNSLTSELRKEVGPEHFLYQWYEKLVVIAKCEGNDDVLVARNDDFVLFFWVHLTWSGKIDQFPSRYPDAGPVLNADLVQFFEQYCQSSLSASGPPIKLEQAELLEKLSATLVGLELSGEIVVCSNDPHSAARKLLEAVRYT
jgi:hypothetical protein